MHDDSVSPHSSDGRIRGGDQSSSDGKHRRIHRQAESSGGNNKGKATHSDHPTSLFNSFAATSPEIRAHVLKRILDECTRTEISFVKEYVRAVHHADFSYVDQASLTIQESHINDVTHRLALLPTAWKKSDPPTLSSLADEILLQIFYHVGDPTTLALSARVCKKWGVLIRDNLLWRSFCLRNGFGPLRPWGAARKETVHRSALHGLVTGHRTSPYMGRRRRTTSSSPDEGGRVGRKTVDALGSHAMTGLRKRNGSGNRSKMWMLPSLAPWKAIYKQNYMTDLNWKRGRYTVMPASSFSGLQGKLCMHFDENWVVSVALGEDGRLWDIQTGRCHMRLVGHNGIISAVKFDKRYVVSGGVDATIKVWDAATGICLRNLRGHEGEIVSVQYNQKYVVSASEDKTIRVWSITDGSEIMVLRGHEGPVCCIQFDGTRIVSGSTDFTIKLWHIDSPESLATFSGHTGNVYCVQLHGNTLCSGSEDSTIKIWNIATRSCTRTLTGHLNGVVCIQFDEYKLVSGSADKSVKVWDMRNGECLYTLMQHTGTVWNLTFTDSKLITSSFDQSLLVWDFTFMHEDEHASGAGSAVTVGDGEDV